MSKIYIVVMSILLLLEFANRKLENKIKDDHPHINREALLDYLEGEDAIDYRFEARYSCDLNDLYIGIHDKEIYNESDKIIIAHELGHLKFFKKKKDTLLFKIFLYSKGLFYLLFILVMFLIVLSILIPVFAYGLKYALISLILVQGVHFLLLAYTELVANVFVHKHYPLNLVTGSFLHLSTVSQLLYWFLFILLTASLYQFLIC